MKNAGIIKTLQNATLLGIRISTIFNIATGLAILTFLIYTIKAESIISTISGMNWLFLLPITALFTLGLYIGAYNLKILSDALNIKIRMGDMWNYYAKAWAFGLIIPGKVGEFTFVYLSRKHLTPGQAASISIIDKITTVLTLCILAFAGFFIFFPLKQAIILTAATIAATAAGMAFILTEPGRRIIKKIVGKYSEKFAGFSKTINFLILEEKKAVMTNIAITFFKWCLTAIVTYLAFLAFRESVNPLIILTISATTMLLSLIPITMSGLGIKEGAAVILYGLKGVPPEITISAHIILLIMNYLGAATIFLFMKK